MSEYAQTCKALESGCELGIAIPLKEFKFSYDFLFFLLSYETLKEIIKHIEYLQFLSLIPNQPQREIST